MRIAARTPRGAVVGGMLLVLLGLLAPAAHAAQPPHATQMPHATQPPHATQTAHTARPGHLTRPDAGTGYTWTRLTWTGSGTGIAATNVKHGLYFFYQAAGSTTWRKETVAAPNAGPGYDYYTPALVSVGSSGVGITAVDYYGNLDYWWQAAGTSTWTYLPVARANDFRYQTPSIAVTSYGVVISAGFTFGDLIFFYEYWGDPTWNEEVVADDASDDGDTYPNSSIVVNSDDGINIADNYEGTISDWYQPSGSSTWTQYAVAADATSDPVQMTEYGGNLVIAGLVQNDANAPTLWTQAPGGGWVQTTLYSPTTEYGPPQISAGPDAALVTAPQASGGLRYWRARGAGSPWISGTVVKATKSTFYGLPAAGLTPSSAVVSAINADNGNLVSWFQKNGSNTWTKDQVAKG